jgi:hypothetical protein
LVVFGPDAQGELGCPTYTELAAMTDADLGTLLVAYGLAAANVDDVRYFLRWSAIDHIL